MRVMILHVVVVGVVGLMYIYSKGVKNGVQRLFEMQMAHLRSY